MVGLILARALSEGGSVLWNPPDKPRLRVGARWVEKIRQESKGVCDVLGRAVIFRQQIEASKGQRALPLLALPQAPPPRVGACVSCGTGIEEGWRCPPCLLAVYIALDSAPPQ